ncbi:MAG: hypothetical protein JWM56_458 [Candidatus Peribacteria bacterium]|nr:hypothetical protein [Candidatus Peribacteria bacterium]
MFHALDRLSWRTAAILIVIVCLALYGPFVGNEFINFDDGSLIYQNPIVQHVSIRSVVRAFGSYDPELYIPLTLFTYQVLHTLFGFAPWAYHAASLLFHTANAVLLFACIDILSRRRSVAFFAAVLFAVHPLNTEAVMWASGLKDVLSTSFFLGSVFLYAVYRKDDDRSRLHWSIIVFFLGLLCKVTVITLPVALLLIDWHREKRMTTALVREKFPYLVLSTIFGVIALMGKRGIIGSSDFITNTLLACKSMALYVGQLFAPVKLALLYEQVTPVTLHSAEFFLPILLVLVIVAVAAALQKRLRIVTVCMAFFLMTIIPSFTNFERIGLLFFASDRYFYLPGISLLLLVALGLVYANDRWGKSGTGAALFTSLGLAIVGGLFITAHVQAATWRNNETVFRNVASKFPSAIAENNLGHIVKARGETDTARAYFERSMAITNTYVPSYVSLGTLYREEGNQQKALEVFLKGISMIDKVRAAKGEGLALYYYAGEVEEELGHADASLALFVKATQAGSQFAEPYFNLGLQYEKIGRTDDAQAAYETAITRDTKYIPAHYHLAGIYSAQGKLPAAITQMEAVIRVDPHYARAAEHLANMRKIIEGNQQTYR